MEFNFQVIFCFLIPNSFLIAIHEETMLRRVRLQRTFIFYNNFRDGNTRGFCEHKKELHQTQDRASSFRNLIWIFPAICFGLTYWQYQRLKWKRNLISTLEQRFTSTMEEFPHELLSYVTLN